MSLENRTNAPPGGDELRTAASVLLGRDGPDGLELLVLERSSASRFLPGYAAFPGGSVDGEDSELARRWFGDAAAAARAAAIRELGEEVGMTLTGSGVLDGADLARVDADPPRSEQLVEVAHWIAPEEVPVRFDARYFAVDAGTAAPDPVPDGAETADAWWVSPARLLAEWEEGRRRLYWPTWFTVSEVARCRTVADLLAWRLDTREPTDAEVQALPPSVFRQDR